MKTAAIFLCALCFVSCTLVRADESEMLNSCFKKEGVTFADISELLGGQSEEAIKKRGCIEACYLQKLGLMTENVINIDKMDAMVDKLLDNYEHKEEVRKGLHECGDKAVPNDDPCVVAQRFSACEYEHIQLVLQSIIGHLAK
ncbi:uncharacterized protein LOC116430664 [Nomia melanderi]|uniref:uncharacterized protein LOC116430664 n=1 Tax=Nomia melanderi TaxID=2448451 RepID=UPI001304685B|nr:uncharacterized protein LOC116430664 [Nomia melanderi]